MSSQPSAAVRAAAEHLVRQAEARGNRLRLEDAEAAVIATATMRARGARLTVATTAAAVAAADRDLVALITTICKILAPLGRDPRPYEEALNGNAPPEARPDTIEAPVPLGRDRRSPPPQEFTAPVGPPSGSRYGHSGLSPSFVSEPAR